jgi:uncharacterized protein YbcV (DUF1398 family)
MNLQEKLESAMAYAMAHRPKVGGFPFLAECMRLAGIQKNIWHLPGCTSIYIMKEGSLVQQGEPLVSGATEIPVFNEELLVSAIRADQSGETTFPEFLVSAWQAGVVGYEVDLEERKVSYFGIKRERYVESYPKVEVNNFLI